MGIKYFIFDMDGTLLNSMIYWQQSGAEIAEKYMPGSKSQIRKDLVTLSSTDIMKMIKEKCGEEKGNEFRNEWKEKMEYYYFNKVEMKKGLKEFLDFSKTQHIKMGIATSTPMELAKKVLMKFEIDKYFDVFVDEAAVNGVGKNKPDIYKECLKRLGGDNTNEAAVFEDNVKYMGTAREAGFYVVGVYDDVSKDQKDLAEMVADQYIYSFKDLMK